MGNTFSTVLCDLMIETDTSTKKLADYLGVSVQVVNRWKRGTNTDIYLPRLIMLCKYFGCSLDYLAGKRDTDVKPNNYHIPNFGKRIREVMKSKNITTYRIQKETRFGDRYFHDWDNGSNPKLNTLIRLANYFGCTLDELVGLE